MRKTLLLPLIGALSLAGCVKDNNDNSPTPVATASYTICESYNCGDPVTVTIDESK